MAGKVAGKVAFDRLSPRGREDAEGKCGCHNILIPSSLPCSLQSLLQTSPLTYRYPLLPVSISRPNSGWKPYYRALTMTVPPVPSGTKHSAGPQSAWGLRDSYYDDAG